MTSQLPVEIILLRQVASYLAMPVLIMDYDGTLLFYNEPAENLLGISFDEAGSIGARQLAGMFSATDLEGRPLQESELSVVWALNNKAPSHQRIRFQVGEGKWHEVEVIAVPLMGHGERFLGVLATLWEFSS